MVQIVNTLTTTQINTFLSLLATITYIPWSSLTPEQQNPFIIKLGSTFITSLLSNNLVNALLDSENPEYIVESSYIFSLCKMLFMVFGFDSLAQNVIIDSTTGTVSIGSSPPNTGYGNGDPTTVTASTVPSARLSSYSAFNIPQVSNARVAGTQTSSKKNGLKSNTITKGKKPLTQTKRGNETLRMYNYNENYKKANIGNNSASSTMAELNNSNNARLNFSFIENAMLTPGCGKSGNIQSHPCPYCLPCTHPKPCYNCPPCSKCNMTFPSCGKCTQEKKCDACCQTKLPSDCCSFDASQYEFIQYFCDLYPNITSIIGGSSCTPATSPVCGDITCGDIPQNFDDLSDIPSMMWRFYDYAYCDFIAYVIASTAPDQTSVKINDKIKYLSGI
jgi:hypothetical protein